MQYVVIIQRTTLQRDVYGPYKAFKAAEGDAKAWGGTVEPLQAPAAGIKSKPIPAPHCRSCGTTVGVILDGRYGYRCDDEGCTPF